MTTNSSIYCHFRLSE